MDLDAEMAQLQAEAQRQLRARDESDASQAQEAGQADPASGELSPEEDLRTFPKLPDLKLPDLSQAAALAKGLKTVGQATEAAQGVAKSASRFSLLQKAGIALASLVVFVVCWQLFLKSVVEAVLAVALLILILVAIGKLLGWTNSLKKNKNKDVD